MICEITNPPSRLEPKNRKDRGHPVANLAARPSAISDNVNKHPLRAPAANRPGFLGEVFEGFCCPPVGGARALAVVGVTPLCLIRTCRRLDNTTWEASGQKHSMLEIATTTWLVYVRSYSRYHNVGSDCGSGHIEEHVQIGLVASAVPGTAVTSPRTGNGCLRAGDADVGCFGGLGCVRRWLDVDGLLPNAREEEKVPGEVHPGPDGWMADVSGPSVVSFPDQERKRSHGARWPSCAPFLAEGRCMYTEKEEDMCPLNSFNLTTNCNHWRRRH
ncbi:hypothetical protein Bbelb_397600 [Branchiostoma belcheri]|nr:hypothetical protein Bbelb_397600 [Branchiostoma belcheri]